MKAIRSNFSELEGCTFFALLSCINVQVENVCSSTFSPVYLSFMGRLRFRDEWYGADLQFFGCFYY